MRKKRDYGRGSIRQQSAETWEISVSAGIDPLTGRRTRIFRTVRGTKRDAQRALTKLVGEVDQGTLVEPERITFADFIDRWLEHMHHRLRPTTFDRYESYVRCHLVPALGRLQLSQIRPLHLQELEAGRGLGHPRRHLERHHPGHDVRVDASARVDHAAVLPWLSGTVAALNGSPAPPRAAGAAGSRSPGP